MKAGVIVVIVAVITGLIAGVVVAVLLVRRRCKNKPNVFSSKKSNIFSSKKSDEKSQRQPTEKVFPSARSSQQVKTVYCPKSNANVAKIPAAAYDYGDGNSKKSYSFGMHLKTLQRRMKEKSQNSKQKKSPALRGSAGQGSSSSTTTDGDGEVTTCKITTQHSWHGGNPKENGSPSGSGGVVRKTQSCGNRVKFTTDASGYATRLGPRHSAYTENQSAPPGPGYSRTGTKRGAKVQAAPSGKGPTTRYCFWKILIPSGQHRKQQAATESTQDTGSVEEYGGAKSEATRSRACPEKPANTRAERESEMETNRSANISTIPESEQSAAATDVSDKGRLWKKPQRGNKSFELSDANDTKKQLLWRSQSAP